MRTPFGIVGSFEGRDGRHYSVYGLGQSLLMAPLVALGGRFDSALVTLINPIAIAAACAGLLLLGTALGFSSIAGTRLALLVGLGTLAWPQSKFTFEAPLETACAAGAFALLGDGGRARAAGAGALFGFALLVRPSAVLLLPGLLFLLAGGTRERGGRIASFAGGCAPFVAVALFYNWFRWGSLLATGYSLTRFRYFALSWEGLAGLLASPGRGFFWYSPILLLAPFGFRRFRNRRPDLAGAILITCAAYVGFFSLTTIWNGDWTWGPRHLLPLVPLVALFALPLLEPGALGRPVLAPLVAISVLVQLVGSTINYEAYFLWHNDRLRRAGVIERAGRYHFSPTTSQIYVEARQALLFFSKLPERMREHRPGEDASPYRSVLERSATITKRVPDVWWVYLPLAGAPPAATAGLAAFCAALVAGGALSLRRARDA
jgi:hypothetical protein